MRGAFSRTFLEVNGLLVRAEAVIGMLDGYEADGAVRLCQMYGAISCETARRVN